MIQLVGAGKRFGHKLLFEGLSWHVRRGERIGLVGPNGCGKTTLLRILAGALEADDGSVVRSRGVVVGLLDQEHDFSSERSVLQEVRRATPEVEAAQREITELEAHLDGADEATLERYGEAVDRFEALGGYRAETEAKRVLGGLGFAAAEMGDPASRFSGGWRMRIALARLLLTRPDVLLLDEPTNHLDLESTAWLEGELSRWEGAVVTVSHDRYYLNRACKRIAELTPSGVVLYVGDYDAFLEQREKDRALLQKRFDQQRKEIEKTKAFIERFRYKASKAAAVQSRVKALEKVERIELPQSTRAMRGFRFPQPGRTGRLVAELVGVRKAWGHNVVYESLDLIIERGWRVALVGPNGAGKTTLLKVLAGETEIDSGTLRLGHNVDFGYFAQHQLDSLNADMTVMQEMESVADLETWPMVRGILGAFLFSGDEVQKPVGVLSGGEKARLALCKMLLRPVTMLLLDEPTSHLDLQSRASLEDALGRYGGTMIVVSHDRYFINEVCTHVLEVLPGRITWYEGGYDQYLWKKAQEEAQVAGEADPGPAVPKPGSEKERKRREADERQRVYKATAALVKELARAEQRIEELEARAAEIDEALADPAAYQRGGQGAQLSIERASVVEEIAAAYEGWERLEADIESAAEAARNA